MDTLLFAADTAHVAMKRLRAGLSALGRGELARDRQIDLFSNAWQIVDQIHAVRQLLSRLPGEPPEQVEEYISDFSVAQRLRNQMDHLHQNLRNRARSKGERTALFGAISYCRLTTPCPTHEGRDPAEVEWVQIFAGTSESFVGPVVDLQNDFDPSNAGKITLLAFSEAIHIDRAVDALPEILGLLSESLEANFMQQIAAQVPPEKYDEVMQPVGGHTMLVMNAG